MTSDLQPRPGPTAPVIAHRDFPADTAGHRQPTVVDVLRVFRRRFWVVALIVAVALGTAVYVTQKTPPTWQAQAQMILVQRPQGVAAQATAGAPPASVATQMTMLKDQEMARRALDHLANNLRAKGQSPDAVGVSPLELQKAIDTANPGDTDLIDLYVKADSPEKAVLLASAVCESFMAWKKEIAQRNSEEAQTNLEVRANRAKVELDAAEQAELRYRQSRHLVDVGTQSSSILSQSLGADSQVTVLQQELSLARTRLTDLGARLHNVDQAIRAGTGVRDDTLVLNLQSQLSGLEIQRAQQAQKYTADFPGVLQPLDAQIKDVQARLTKAVQGTLDNKRPSLQSQAALFQNYEQVQTDVLLTQAKLTAARKLQAQLKAALSSLPQQGLDEARLVRNVDLDRQLYTSLQGALNAARLEKDNATSDVQMVQNADVDPTPVDPSLKRSLAVGAAVGIALALAAVMLLEQADRRVRDLDGLRPLAAGPIIGALPQLSRPQIAALGEGRASMESTEAYSLAGANLGLTLRWAAPADQWDHRVVLITSALPGEGKSVTSAGLARALAQTGKRVVLVNADLRRPTLDTLFPTDDPVGLGDVLEGGTALVDALQPSDLANLQIIHSGRVRQNPTDLITRPAMRNALDALRKAFDIVLIDTPACAVVADALLLAPHADCVLYVVGAGQVDSDVVRAATASLGAAAPRTLAYVMNRAPRQRRYGYQQYYRQAEASVTDPVMRSGEVLFTKTMELRREDLAHAAQADSPEAAEAAVREAVAKRLRDTEGGTHEIQE